ncbi:unnamed protein product [Sphagnum tenellum]
MLLGRCWTGILLLHLIIAIGYLFLPFKISWLDLPIKKAQEPKNTWKEISDFDFDYEESTNTTTTSTTSNTTTTTTTSNPRGSMRKVKYLDLNTAVPAQRRDFDVLQKATDFFRKIPLEFLAAHANSDWTYSRDNETTCAPLPLFTDLNINNEYWQAGLINHENA